MIEEMGIMTFPEASVCWKKERSYVMQQHTKYPDKFLHESIGKIGIGKGTWIITKKGMEHLTGKTEEQANKESALMLHRSKTMFKSHNERVKIYGYKIRESDVVL